MKRKALRRLWIRIALAFAFAFGTPAAAQQTRAQQKCIQVLNVGMAKVAKAQVTANKKCAKAFAKNSVANPDPDACVQNNGKVIRAQDKLAAKAATVCAGGGLPSIGPDSDLTASQQGQSAALGHAYGLISAGGLLKDGLVECSDAPEKAGCKCQDAILATSGKHLGLYFKLFNKCKKKGLRSSAIVSDADLQNCLTQPGQLDPKGKLAKSLTKLTAKIDGKCSGAVTNPLPNGVCAGLTGANLAGCIDRDARCAACLAIGATDNLPGPGCDVFDDGTSNGSCIVID